MKRLIIILATLTLLVFTGCIPENSLIARSELTATHSDLSDESIAMITDDNLDQTTHVTLTVTHQPSNESLPLPTDTPEPIVGILEISSIPTSANFTIDEVGVNGITPYSIILPPGFYTVTFSLDGYHDQTEIVSITRGQTVEIQGDLSPSPMNTGTYYSVVELDGDGGFDGTFLAYVAWHPEEPLLIYAIDQGLRLDEPRNWSWWEYNLLTQETIKLVPPASMVDGKTREMLGLCPLDELEWDGPAECKYLATLFESEKNELVLYSPLLLEDFPFSEGELWMAKSDGTMAQQLADFSPAYAHWSNDGQWLLTGMAYAGLPGQVIHYLVSTSNSFAEPLQSITGADNFYLNGLWPEFSPNKPELLYYGSKIMESTVSEDYHLYSLNLNDFESRLLTDKFGLFQWSENGEGVYVLDGAFTPLDPLDSGLPHTTNLYYINITQDSPREYLIAQNISYRPVSYYGSWNWAYSPIHHAIAYINYDEDKLELGILQLEP